MPQKSPTDSGYSECAERLRLFAAPNRVGGRDKPGRARPVLACPGYPRDEAEKSPLFRWVFAEFGKSNMTAEFERTIKQMGTRKTSMRGVLTALMFERVNQWVYAQELAERDLLRCPRFVHI
jgi:hypothetical protein